MQRIEQLKKEIEMAETEVASKTNNLEVAKSSIGEATEKIDMSEQELELAYTYMANNINTEISILTTKIPAK